MVKCWFIWVLSLFCLQTIAIENSLRSTYLGSREGDPASLIENVSTIHGDYSESEVDLVVLGPDPLTLARYYSSNDDLSITTLGAWRFYPQCFLTIQKDPEEQEEKGYTSYERSESTYAYTGTSEGSILTYTGSLNCSSTDRCLFEIDVDGILCGLSNSARGPINGWTNLKNNELYFDPQGDCWELILSNGGKRNYVNYLLHKAVSL